MLFVDRSLTVLIRSKLNFKARISGVQRGCDGHFCNQQVGKLRLPVTNFNKWPLELPGRFSQLATGPRDGALPTSIPFLTVFTTDSRVMRSIFVAFSWFLRRGSNWLSFCLEVKNQLSFVNLLNPFRRYSQNAGSS